MKKNTFWDWVIIGGIVVIGLAEAAHLAAVFLKLSFTVCAMLLWGLLGIAAICVVGVFVVGRRSFAKAEGSRCLRLPEPGSRTECVLWALFAAVLLSQLIFVCMGDTNYRQKDMTVEVVGSFLVSDGIYQVNPMTGMPFSAGMPSRLKILCLPTLYGSLCRLTGLAPRTIVWRVVPVLTLLGCYGAFSSLGRALFPEDGKKRACFRLMVSVLLWAGAYPYGMDGFNVLCCGWRGIAIRNGILLPWLFSLCLRKKWPTAFLCVLAEGCMVWTLYGCGACLLAMAGMAGARFCCRLLWREPEAAGRRKEKRG